MEGFWQDSWKSFKAVSGPILAGAALLLALLGPLYAPGAVVQVSVIWLTVSGLLALAVLLTAGNLVMVARTHARGRLPKVLHVSMPTSTPGQSERFVTPVLDRSELFGVNILVTIYYVETLGPGRDDVFERQIGIGRVTNIQQNDLVQVTVLAEMPAHTELWQRIRNREAATISQVVVKPSVSYGGAGIEVWSNE